MIDKQLLKEMSATIKTQAAEVERLTAELTAVRADGLSVVLTSPTEGMLRPFYQCPPDELPLAWAAALMVSKVAIERREQRAPVASTEPIKEQG